MRGDGARVALNLVGEMVSAFYNDWVAPEGYYSSTNGRFPSVSKRSVTTNTPGEPNTAVSG